VFARLKAARRKAAAAHRSRVAGAALTEHQPKKVCVRRARTRRLTQQATLLAQRACKPTHTAKLEMFMKTTRFVAALSTALALGAFGTAAHAQTSDDMSFAGMFKADRIDKNKDKMVSKAEFLEMIGKMWDMKAKEMKAKDDKLNMQQYEQVLAYMKLGG
jgi:hypothetical protein